MAKREFDIVVPDFGTDWNAEIAWIEELIQWGIKHYIDTNDLKGYIWTHGVADGCAYYMVTCLRPLTLCHIPVGDCWHVPVAHLRGLNLEDIKLHAEQAKAWRELVNERGV